MRVLAIRPGGIGDTILCFPAMEHLSPAEVWVRGATVPLVHFASERACSIASTGLDQMGLPGLPAPSPLVDRLRRFDRIVSWYGAKRPEFRAAADELGLPFEFHDALPEANAACHAVDFFSKQVGAKPGSTPRIPIAANKRAFTAVHPYSGGMRKNWPLDEIVDLAKESPFPLEWCATSEQAPLLEAAGCSPVQVFDDLGELAYWLAGARLYIGNDCGITHLAAALGVPTLALFRASDSRIWGPRGEQVEILEYSSGSRRLPGAFRRLA